MKKYFNRANMGAKSATLSLVMGIAGITGAQDAVTLTSVLDVAVANTASVHAATYSVADNKFLASAAPGNVVRIYNGVTGAFESNLSVTGINFGTPTLGIFALASGTDGSIFAFKHDPAAVAPTHELYQWDNVSDATPAIAGVPIPFSRTGQVIGNGVNTKVALTGDANSGPIHILSTTDDITFTETDTVPAAAGQAKGAMAINNTATETWGTGDTGTASVPKKAVKTSGTWAADPGFVVLSTSGNSPAAVLTYDSVNNVLFGIAGTKLFALHGDTGAQLGTATLALGFNATPGYGGGTTVSTNGAGTLWLAGRGATTTNVALAKFTYTVTFPATAAQDWALFE